MSYYDEYKVDVPEGEAGPWKVKKFTVSKQDEEWGAIRSAFSFGSRGRFVPEGTYTGLYRNGAVIMSDTPDEIRDHLFAIRRAKGKCLVNGLGLGVVVEAMLRKPEVTHVTVIEISPEVIQLVGTGLKARYSDRVTIVQADAFTWNPPKGETFEVVWNDVWDNLCSDNLESMAKLHRKYGRKAVWKGSWGKEICQSYRRRSSLY